MTRPAALLAALLVAAASSAAASPAAPKDPGMITVIVTLRESPAPGATPSGSPRASRIRKVVSHLRARTAASQQSVRAFLRAGRSAGRVGRVRPFWIFNGLAVTATPAAVRELAARKDVVDVHRERTFDAPPAIADSAPEPTLALVEADALWQLGIDGRGIVVASLDTGVDASHPDLASSWRGGENSWFDPNAEHAAPLDPNGHGTWTTSIMVGADAGGTAIGVAPGAQWIAAKIFDDQGVARESGIHEAFQWLLDPDGDLATADAPQVVNASWTFAAPGCDLAFETDIQALRAAGILPVFAAGNSGPGSGTSMSPANNPGALSVGAVDVSDLVFAESSRGPSACADAGGFPDLAAPGVDVRAADLFGGYRTVSGTSLAAPHVAGALALLLQVFPGLSADGQEQALLAGASDLGLAGPDDDTGSGRLDVLASYRALGGQEPPPPPPPPPPPAPPPLYLTALRTAAYRPADILVRTGRGLEPAVRAEALGLADTVVDALAFVSSRTLLVSLARPARLPGIGRVDDSDIVRVHLNGAGAGRPTFALELDGSDVGLDRSAEDVDALELTPRGRLLVSFTGRVRLANRTFRDEDVVAFTPLRLGPTTRGRWGPYLDGSAIGLGQPGEDVDAIALDPAGRLFLSTAGRFSTPALSGSPADIFVCRRARRPGPRWRIARAPALDGASVGLAGGDVESIELPPLSKSGVPVPLGAEPRRRSR